MNAAYDQATRLEKAKDLAETLVRNTATGTQITLISNGRYPKVEINNTVDKQEALQKIKSLKTTNSSGNINDAVSMVKAISKQALTYKAIFYTDGGVNLEGLNGEVVSIAKPVENISLDMLTHTIKDGRFNILIRATNHGSTDVIREVTVYGNENVLDIKNIELRAGESKSILAEGVGKDISYIYAELNEEDGLGMDNVIYDVVKPSQLQKVLLVSQSNIFIEKAFSIIDNVELYKSNPGDEIQGEYDLYIYDGTIPASLPQKGSIMLLNPPSGSALVEVQGEIEGGAVNAVSHSLTKYLENTSFAVSKLKAVELPYYADKLLEVGGNTAAFIGQYRERKTAVIAFDLHNSDFVLMPEYPVFMNNIAGYLINVSSGEKSVYKSGEAVEINPMPDAKEAFIESAENKHYDVELKYPILPFENTEEIGVYKLIQRLEAEEVQSLFAVNFPTDTESNTRAQQTSQSAELEAAKAFVTGRRIASWLMILVLLIAAVEWVVYIRGY
jgi:hypothetical protein